MVTPSEQLTAWVEGELASRRPGERLPTDAALAGKFGLSERTVRRLLSELRGRGRVWRVRGKGTFVPGHSGTPGTAVEARRTSSQTIVDAVYRAICSGEIKQGEALPSVKSMCVQFGVSAPTVIRAYRELQRMEHVTKVGKGFWVGQFTPLVRQRIKRQVFLFRFGSDDFGEVFNRDMMAPAYRRMERELSANGCVLLCQKAEVLPGLAGSWARQRRYPLGVAFFSTDADSYDRTIAPSVAEMRRNVEHGPTVLIDNRTDFVRNFAGTTVLTRGNISTAAARAAAQFVVRSGHRCAYVFADAAAPYDPARGRLWGFWPLIKLRTELTGLNPDFAFRMVLRVPPDKPSAREQFLQNLRRFPLAHQRSLLSKYRETSLETVVGETVFVESFEEQMGQVNRGDVWVFPTHGDTARGLAVAQERGTPVPGKLAVLSLENDPSYYHLGVSYCEPDWDAIGYLMAHAILRDIPVERTTRGFLRTGARVVEKLTTR